ncbi:hypothetical protein, partial [Roseibium denhamense]|uniref:hypothetical protein n=1 Tax=Roseibium denhamense TaxID=76305 RepID=UPI0031E24A24
MRRHVVKLGVLFALVAAVVATGAAVTGATPASAAPALDDILLDSFTGTDDEKLTQALAVAK